MNLRVTRPHALVLLKLLALDDRYRNMRGPEHAEHDRDEGRVHASDIVFILNAAIDIAAFREAFYRQFAADPVLGMRVTGHLENYFQQDTSPGILLYEEMLRAGAPVDRNTRVQLADELRSATRMMAQIIPSGSFSVLRSAIDDICNLDQHRGLAENFLRSLANAGVSVSSEHAIQFFPGEVFGGAFGRGEVFKTSAHEETQKLGPGEKSLLAAYWRLRTTTLLNDEEFKARFKPILQ